MSDLSFKVFDGRDTRQPWKYLPDLRYNGSPFPRDFQYKKTKHVDDLVFADDYAEGNILLDAIIQVDILPSDIWHLRPADYGGKPVPDFSLVVDGATVYTECTRSGDNAVIRFEDKLPQMQARMNRWLQEEKSASTALGGRHVGFVPGIFPRDEDSFVYDMQRFILNEDLTDYGDGATAPPKYEVLFACDTGIISNPNAKPHVAIRNRASWSGGPLEAAKLAIRALEAKRNKSYDDFRPVWLAIGITNLHWTAEDFFETLKHSITAIEPFERVFFCNSRTALQIAKPPS